MRISTSQLYDRSIRYILDNHEKMQTAQQQVATGKRISKPSDDPVGATQVIRMTESLQKLEQFQRNNTLLQNNLQQEEAVMSNITQAANRARQLVVQAGNGINTAQDRRAISIELEKIRDQIFDSMNTRNAEGEYIFAGYQSKSPAFEFNPADASQQIRFVGDDGHYDIQVSENVRIQSNDSGKTVFQNVLARLDSDITGTTASAASVKVAQQGSFDQFHKANYDPVTPANNNFRVTINAAGDAVMVVNTGTGASMGTFAFNNGEPFGFEGLEFTIDGNPGDTVDFQLNPPEKKNLAQTIHELTLVLNDPATTPTNLETAISDALVGLDNGMHTLSNANAALGGRLNVAEAIYASNLDLEIAIRESKADIEEVDMAEAISELSKAETALSAAQQTFARVTQISLFDFL